MRLPLFAALALATTLAGCSRSSGSGHAAPATGTIASGSALAPSTSVRAAGSASVAPEHQPVPAALGSALDAAMQALVDGDLAAADRRLAEADRAAGGDAHYAYVVARVRATRHAQAGDFDRAAATLLGVIPTLAKHSELPDEFSAHNAMMMIREAQGDPAAALAENDAATRCAARGSWEPEGRETLAFQKDRWHRAYLTRMLAESRTGADKADLIRKANAALGEYKTRGFPDSVAVLEAYFAALDGRRADALAAARKVDLEQDDDLEDLYLVVVGLEAGGDAAGAEAVRARMRRPDAPRISRAIMLRWLDVDVRWPKGGGFSPRHAAGR